MTKIVANKKLNLSDYDPFEIFAENEFYTSQTKTGFTAVFDTTALVVNGSGFNTIGVPINGTIDQITVFIDNSIHAKFSDFSFGFPAVGLTTQTSEEAMDLILSKADNITGSKKSDVLIGLGGDDTIKAGGGNDSINVGTGSDNKATGGAGKDTFLFTGPGFVTITDFNPAADRFAFETDDFTMFDEGKLTGMFRVGKEAKDGNDFLIYDKSTGKLFLDVDANEDDAPLLFLAKLVGKPALTAGDFFGV